MMNLFVPYVATNAAPLGVLPATAAAQSATAPKNERKAALTALGRPVIQSIQSNPAVKTVP